VFETRTRPILVLPPDPHSRKHIPTDASAVARKHQWAALLATGSAMLLGYAVGRITYSNDLRSALRRIEASPEPIDVLIRTL
jgi:hypothetical protein